MRIAAQHPRHIGDLHLIQHLGGAVCRAGFAPTQNINQAVADLAAYAALRVQRGQRVLRDQGTARADQFAARRRGQGQKIDPIQQNLPRGDGNRARQYPQNGLANHRLARATFTH